MAATLEVSLRVATINVRGLADRRRQYQPSRLFAENEVDIIAVQETKVENQERTDRKVQPFRTLLCVCFSHADVTSGDCCLFDRRSLDVVESSIVSCAYGRFVLRDFSWSNVHWSAICVYAATRVRECTVSCEA